MRNKRKLCRPKTQAIMPAQLPIFRQQCKVTRVHWGAISTKQIGGRYIYAGSRYTTAPVVDLTSLTNTPTSPYTVSGPTLPVYDTDYTGSGSTSTAAYSQDSVTVDQGYTVQYGVTSNATGFQQVIAGLQLMKTAAASGDATTYQTGHDPKPARFSLRALPAFKRSMQASPAISIH